MNKRFSLEEIEDAIIDHGGFCVSCGEEACNIEPDAREYECESCGERTIYGAEELLITSY